MLRMLQIFKPLTPMRHLLVPFQLHRAFSRRCRPINVQYVKFKKPWKRCVSKRSLIPAVPHFYQLNLRKVLFTCIAYGAATLAWSSLVLASLDVIRDITRTYDEHGSKGDAVFIPFGWPHLKPGKYYAGDDPEWEMFREISNNPKYLAALRGKDIGGLFQSLDILQLTSE